MIGHLLRQSVTLKRATGRDAAGDELHGPATVLPARVEQTRGVEVGTPDGESYTSSVSVWLEAAVGPGDLLLLPDELEPRQVRGVEAPPDGAGVVRFWRAFL